MKTEHTPGPWAAILVDDYDQSFVIDAGVTIAGLRVWPVAADEMAANAALIAAAPDLLAALQRMVYLFEPMHGDPNGTTAGGAACLSARAAIAKATGSAA